MLVGSYFECHNEEFNEPFTQSTAEADGNVISFLAPNQRIGEIRRGIGEKQWKKKYFGLI